MSKDAGVVIGDLLYNGFPAAMALGMLLSNTLSYLLDIPPYILRRHSTSIAVA